VPAPSARSSRYISTIPTGTRSRFRGIDGERRRHHERAELQKPCAADHLPLAAQRSEPQERHQRAGDREVGAEIDADQHGTPDRARQLRALQGAAGDETYGQVVDEVAGESDGEAGAPRRPLGRMRRRALQKAAQNGEKRLAPPERNRPVAFGVGTLMYATPGVRKRRLDVMTAPSEVAADEIDIARCATLLFSSEQPTDPIEHLVERRSDRRWIAARADTTETIVVEFDRPEVISRLVYEVAEVERERTQEVRVEISEDGGRTYRQILVQEYNFSPRGATFERQDLRFERRRASHVRLTIVPNKRGFGAATLTTLRLFA
jgi:F5/8 type C domain